VIAVKWLVTPLLLLTSFAGVAGAQTPIDDLLLGVGRSGSGVETYRLGLRSALSRAFFQSNVGYLSGYGEVAFLYWANGCETVYGGVLAPGVAYYFGDESVAVRPYIGGSIGVAHVSDTRIGRRDLSTRFQFEDRIGIGIRLSRLDVYVSYVHYSNASLKSPNDGMDTLLLTLAWSLQ
jgi:lipid A 3-O-deacylase